MTSSTHPLTNTLSHRNGTSTSYNENIMPADKKFLTLPHPPKDSGTTDDTSKVHIQEGLRGTLSCWKE